MGEEEKQDLQPQKEEAAEAAPAYEAVEKISDDEFASLLGESFGDFKKLSALLPSFKTADGDLVRGVEWLDPKKSFQRKEFLTKKDFATQRKLLAQRLETWIKFLAAEEGADAEADTDSAAGEEVDDEEESPAEVEQVEESGETEAAEADKS